MKKLFTMIRRGNLAEVAAILDKKPTRHSLTWTVDDTMTAKRIGTAGAKILSTPNMLALMEACALELVRGRDCGDGQSVEKFAENLS